jgi:hypothetical protein
MDPVVLQAAVLKLQRFLEANDLTALEAFAELRGDLGVLAPALLDPLEEALQELDLSAALQHCRVIASWLEGVCSEVAEDMPL